MAELVKLEHARHGHLKIRESCALEQASQQHLVNLRVTEVCQAVSSMPVFVTRVSDGGDWALSGICSFTAGGNLFVADGAWAALYQPSAMRTYPIYLMQAAGEKRGYTLGIDENSSAFSTENGEPLFSADGKQSLYLQRVRALLEADIGNDLQTRSFTGRLEQLGLLKAVDLLLEYESSGQQTIGGLHTMDEDVLKSLSADALAELHSCGYLAPIHAQLISLFQLNALIRLHNDRTQSDKLRQLKLETAKDHSAA